MNINDLISIFQDCLIVFAFISIIIIMIYSNAYYYTIISYIYQHSIFNAINDGLHFSYVWNHFGGPSMPFDVSIKAIVYQDEKPYDIVLYDPATNTTWQNKKINVLDAKWFEYVKNGNQDAVKALYNYLQRLYRTDRIQIQAHFQPMKGFHAINYQHQGFLHNIDIPKQEHSEDARTLATIEEKNVDV